MFNKEQNKSIYKHDHLDPRSVERMVPLMESAFRNELSQYSNRKDNGNGEILKKEKIKFLSEQYANRVRIANNMGVKPLNEDAAIFSNIGSMGKLFESVSSPGSIIGMGEVSNPDSSNQHTGGIWNPAYKAGSGDIPSYVFGLQAHIAMYCIGFDLIPTISVDTPKVMISFVDTVYGGGTFDDVENLPSFIEISAPVFTAAWVKTSKLKRSTTKLYFRTAAGAGSPALEVRFVVKSTVKAAVTVEVLSTGTLDAADVYTKTDTYTVKEIIDLLNAAATGVAKVVYFDPAAPTTAIETPIGGIASAGYASATRTNIAEAASNNNSLGGMSRAQQEKGPKHKLNVIAMDKQLEMVGIEIEADTSNIQIKDMAAMGINVIARLYNGVQNQLVQTLDEVITTHLYAMGVQHAVNTVRSQGINHSIYLDTPSKVSLDFSTFDVSWLDMLGADVRADMGVVNNNIVSSAYENQMTHADRLFARILLVAEFVAQQNRIGGPDFIVLGGALASAMKKHITYTASPIANTLAAAPELHYSGTIFETMSVYKNPRIDFNDPRILIGRRGNDTDPGSKFLAYDLAASRQTLSPETMAEKIRVWSRFAIADIGFYPELNYYTMIAVNGYAWS